MRENSTRHLYHNQEIAPFLCPNSSLGKRSMMLGDGREGSGEGGWDMCRNGERHTHAYEALQRQGRMGDAQESMRPWSLYGDGASPLALPQR